MHTYRIQCTIDLRKPRTQLLSSVWHHSTNVLKMYYSTVLTHDRQRKQLPSLAHTLAAPAKPVVVIQNWLTGLCHINVSLCSTVPCSISSESAPATELLKWPGPKKSLGGQSCNDCSACPRENVMVWQSGVGTKPGRLQTQHITNSQQ